MGNMTSLAVLQMVNFILPLLTVPYLVRVVGIDRYGLIAFAQSIIQFFIIFTDFGFNLSATREIAANRDDHAKVEKIFSAVMTVRALLLVVGFFILMGVVSIIPRLREEAMIFYLTYGLVAGGVLFPVWCFQGLEKMKHSTAMNLISRSIFVLLIFVVVRRPEDYLLVPVLSSAGMIVAGIISLIILRTKFGIRFRLVSAGTLLRQMRSSLQFFVATLASSVFSSFNTLVLGFVTTNEIVGYYAAAEKLFVAMRGLFQPIATALYPYMSFTRNIKLYRRIFGWSMSGAFLVGSAAWLGSDLIVKIVFGEGFDLSAQLLRIFAAVVPISAASLLIGYPLLAALGLEKYANYSNSAGAVIHLLLVAAILPVISPALIVLVMLTVEIAVLAMKLIGVRRHGLWRLDYSAESSAK